MFSRDDQSKDSADNSDFIATVIKELLSKQNIIEDKQLLEDVIQVLRDNNGCLSLAGLQFLSPKLLALIITYSNSANEKIGDYLIDAVANFDIDLVSRLSALANFKDLVYEHNVYEDIVQWILNISNDKTLQYFQNQFEQNDNAVDYDGILLTCAQIANRKKSYSFKPTVLDSNKEFEDYVDFVAEMPYPLHERFILNEAHRVCGEIRINIKGEVSIILLDSLGISTDYSINQREKLARTFPRGTLFIPETKLQNDYTSCAIFALDALFQLYTISKYLPRQYKRTAAPLHAYLAAHKIGTLDPSRVNEAKIIRCTLPLRMMLNMQSRNLFNEITERVNEATLPVNKKGETAYAAAKKHFRKKQPGYDTSNHRIEDKLKSMYVNNMNYLFSNSGNDFRADMKEFSFAAFRRAHVKRTYEDKLDLADESSSLSKKRRR